MTAEIPELAIIETQTWEAAQARRRNINAAPLTQRSGPKRLLSGLLKCGACGASFIATILAASAVMTGTAAARSSVSPVASQLSVVAGVGFERKHYPIEFLVAG
jgi:hypothetical protein